MSYFDENRKFLALNGVLGRRDFIVNCLIIEIIESLFVLTPVFIASVISPEFKDITLGQVRPFWYMLLQCIIGLASTGLYFPSVVRRVRDILGEEDDNRIFLISSVISVIIFMGYTPVANSFFGGWILLFTLLSLIFMAGKITGENPKSDVIKFNWGACFGTWIWGLVNKVPVTLLMIPLLFTLAWVPFMVLCGMKGNEWAYNKNKEKFENVDSFHSVQKNQSKLMVILAPIIALITFLATFTLLFVSVKTYAKYNPKAAGFIKNYISQYQLSSAEDGFEYIKEEDGVYSFFLDPDEWTVMVKSDFIRKSIIRNALNYALIKNDKEQYSVRSLLENVEIVNRTKVYSDFNNEVLVELVLDVKKAKEYAKQLDDKQKSNEIIEFINSGYKFNYNPSIP